MQRFGAAHSAIPFFTCRASAAGPIRAPRATRATATTSGAAPAAKAWCPPSPRPTAASAASCAPLCGIPEVPRRIPVVTSAAAAAAAPRGGRASTAATNSATPAPAHHVPSWSRLSATARTRSARFAAAPARNRSAAASRAMRCWPAANTAAVIAATLAPVSPVRWTSCRHATAAQLPA